MSEVSAEEKRRILRERRQAKLAHGNASSRLNQILNNGSVPESSAEKTPREEPLSGETEIGENGSTKITEIGTGGSQKGTGGSQIGNETGKASNSTISSEPVAMSTATDIGVNSASETLKTVNEPEHNQKGNTVNLDSSNLDSLNLDSLNLDSSNLDSSNLDSLNLDSPNLDSSNLNSSISSNSNSNPKSNPNSSNSNLVSNLDLDHDDPEGPDISSVSHPTRVSEPQELDMDTLLKQIFNGSNGQNGIQPEAGDFFANMMKAVAEDDGNNMNGGSAYNAASNTSPPNIVAYQQYQQKQLDARFTLIRLLTHVSIFAYHYYTQPSFRSSAYAYIRTQSALSCTYSRSFISAEIAFVSAYYYLMSSKGLLHVASSNNWISKLLSMASAVFPPANAYQPLVNTLLVYWGGASIVISDLSLVVLMFGLVSIFS